MTPFQRKVLMDDYAMYMAALQSLNNSLANSANVFLASNTSKEDRKFSREMSDLAWQRNLEAWNMQNEYNDPTNVYARQLEGIRANGLNPNLVYGGSSSVTGNAGSVSPYKFEGWHSQSPHFAPSTFVQDLYNTRLLQTQVAAQEANIRLINARADAEEARVPGYRARSDEAAYRWNYIRDNIADTYEAGIRAQESEKYWSGVQTEYNAHYAKDRSTIEYYRAVMAEWLNTEKVPGLNVTYQQYAEQFRSYLPAEQWEKLKQETLNIASTIAYRKKQGEMLDLKMVYQRCVNRFAFLGRTLNGSWVNLLLSGLMHIFGVDDEGNLTNPAGPVANGTPYDDWWRGQDYPQTP